MSMPFFSLSRGKDLSTLLKWETHPDYSREAVTLLAGDGAKRSVSLGMILAILMDVAAAGAAVSADAGNTGDGVLTLAAPALTKAAQEGVYTLVCVEPATGGGVFEVEDPSGKSLGSARVGEAFGKHIRFTIAAGATDFAAGDRIEVTVTRASAAPNAGKVVAWDPAASDGSQVIWGIALNEATAPDGQDLVGGLVGLRRAALVSVEGIDWPASTTGAQKALALERLEELGIVARPH